MVPVIMMTILIFMSIIKMTRIGHQCNYYCHYSYILSRCPVLDFRSRRGRERRKGIAGFLFRRIFRLPVCVFVYVHVCVWCFVCVYAYAYT